MPTPFGPLGLLLSLFAILILALAYFLAPVALVALIDVIAQGEPHFLAQVDGMWTAGMTSAQEPLITFLFGLGIVFYAAILGAIVTLGRWRAGTQWPSLVAWTRWSPRRAGWGFWLLVASGLLYGLAASVALSLLRPHMHVLSNFPHGPIGLAISFILIVIAAPIAEETLFRGWIFTSLRARFSFPLANIVTAAAFAVAHWDKTHLYALAIFPLGLLLGVARERQGSVAASATFHGLYNGFAWMLTLYSH